MGTDFNNPHNLDSVVKRVATRFQFCGYFFDVSSLEISFDYAVHFKEGESLRFTEKIILPEAVGTPDAQLLQNCLESLHLILGISYYKTYIPPEIELPLDLTEEQAEFWDTVYRKGLGEFLYRNHLDPNAIARFPFTHVEREPVRFVVQDRMLLGIGGGKDSIVVAELLRDFSVTSFLVETEKRDAVSDAVIAEIGNPSLTIRRHLDPKLFGSLPDAYNGHIPISAVFAFLGLLSATLYKYRFVVVGNEHSSNFGNLVYEGETINHQWSKSAEFESLFQEYTRKFITPDIIYFSLLRQFHEIRIAKLFAKYEQYFPIFSSCNRSFKVFEKRGETRWCGECAKCAFTFLILSPFIPKVKLVRIFRKNLFADEKLLPIVSDILGFGEMKPFDCVGTFEESRVALTLSAEKYAGDIIMETFLPKIGDVTALTSQVFRTTVAPTLPTSFRFLGIESVCILGYGREGRVTERYLRQYYPHIRIGIADAQLNDDYLAEQNNYDLVVKTPGIQKSKVMVPSVTATHIFFAQNKNFTIGVTGSKGKSTTVSLIYEMLKEAGKKVRLLGNIGTPMLEVFLVDVDPEEIFVIELSSYMLDDIEYSPNIAVLLNLFPDHMDYHGGVEAYYAAKRRIFQFQKLGDIGIEGPVTEHVPIDRKELTLLGDHNFQNIQMAVKVARLCKVSDDAIACALRNFKPLPHRLGHLGTFQGIDFYDDAISTTPESTIAAIRALGAVDTIFLGGTDRGYDFRALEQTLRDFKVRNVVLFPESGARILSSWDGFNIFETKSMEEAVDFAFKNTEQGKICLLSTASPSYSLWKNFEMKGDEFAHFVRASEPHEKSI
ncbi:MAG: Mur ligase family protein [Candidatus Moraniibacteriota bacterium]